MIPRFCFLLCAFLLIGFSPKAQKKYFEGVIHYELYYPQGPGSIDPEQAAHYMGSEQNFYIKGKRYKWTNNGEWNIRSIYTGKDTIYTIMDNLDAILYQSTRQNNDSLISVKFLDQREVINGYECQVLQITSRKMKKQYFFSRELQVNPKYYRDHQYTFWNICLEKTGGALPLKLIVQEGNISTECIARNIMRKKLSSKEFKLPKNRPFKKSPFVNP